MNVIKNVNAILPLSKGLFGKTNSRNGRILAPNPLHDSLKNVNNQGMNIAKAIVTAAKSLDWKSVANFSRNARDFAHQNQENPQ
ncbi:MAG: hypothetical protein R3E31_15690 [Chloroflexota bacterium]|nr:hypothetical protein [Anaerolineales bacterium]MCA9977798.1 hypothetical protein [Anaerolineales bacterium]MCB8966130.1 hypothetical protein [Ardenticatenaceae bacterium]